MHRSYVSEYYNLLISYMIKCL